MTSARWLFSPAIDLGAFLGAAVLSGAVALVAHLVGVAPETPLWAWLLFVVGIDVAHVWSTLFRVYLDPEERARRPARALAAPLVAYALGVAAYAVSSHAFWRVLAYVAVWHFVRQQVGWMALYGRRAGSPLAQRRFDAAAVYAATLGPVLWWHATLPRPFWWFVEHDFVSLPAWVAPLALGAHAVVLLAWLGHQLVTGRHLGKLALLAATWLAWFGGIVLARSDFAFTVMNVTLHGVPYLVLLYRYARRREAEGGYGRIGALLRVGVPGFVGLLLVLALIEELLWDRLVWHERPQLFGASGFELGEGLLTVLVPLLALPQTTHYLLDGLVWRTADDPRLPARLGWAPEARR